MFRAYKYRIFPNKSQRELLSKHFGHCRFLYNLALETKTSAYLGSKVNYSRYDLQSQLVDLKKECEWLKDVNSQSLQSELMHLDTAYKNFFKGGGFPKYKTKRGKQSFHIPQSVRVKNDRIFIPKFKDGLKVKLHRPYNGVIKSATISKTPTGKYFVSILCETGDKNKLKQNIKEKTAIGIDLGIKDFAITSEGEIFENPKYLRSSIKGLKVLQRRASKKKRGSNNQKKAYKKVALQHERIKNKRQDFLHKLSTKLIRDNQTICLETLNVKGMIKSHSLAQSISDVSWSEFNRMLEYKAEWYGVNILRIGRFAPSSKTCECGHINKGLKLSDRVWKCKSCGRVNERNLLAARNIKKFALKDYSGSGRPVEPVELPTLVGAVKQE